jgi:Ca2+-binding RTX toxin-like protein
LKHPHDVVSNDPGAAPKMPGVTVSTDLGLNDQNHMLFTQMSYNANYGFDVKGHIIITPGSALTVDGGINSLLLFDYGYAKTPMAYDIAAMQFLYNERLQNIGDDVYNLPGADGVGVGWTCIWDTSGYDVINYRGKSNVLIDLHAATLDGSSRGGGELSYAAFVHGGYTIAHGVEIEAASGGSGNDTLIGSEGANTLSGTDGDDLFIYSGGMDTIFGGYGSNTVDYSNIDSSSFFSEYGIEAYLFSQGGATKGLGANVLTPGLLKLADGSIVQTQDQVIEINRIIGTQFNDFILGPGIFFGGGGTLPKKFIYTPGGGSDTISGIGSIFTVDYSDDVGAIVVRSTAQGFLRGDVQKGSGVDAIRSVGAIIGTSSRTDSIIFSTTLTEFLSRQLSTYESDGHHWLSYSTGLGGTNQLADIERFSFNDGGAAYFTATLDRLEVQAGQKVSLQGLTTLVGPVAVGTNGFLDISVQNSGLFITDLGKLLPNVTYKLGVNAVVRIDPPSPITELETDVTMERGARLQVEVPSGFDFPSPGIFDIESTLLIIDGNAHFTLLDRDLGFSQRLQNFGVILLANAEVNFVGGVTGVGAIDIAAGSRALLKGAVDADQRVQFLGASASLILATPDTFAAVIAGFDLGDSIVLGTGVPTEAVFLKGIAPNTTILSESNGGNNYHVTLMGDFTNYKAAIGADGAITLAEWATDGDDVIYGTRFADTIDGKRGNDVIYGLGGDDCLIGGPGDDTLDGGEGEDTADYSTVQHVGEFGSAETRGVTINLTPRGRATFGTATATGTAPLDVGSDKLVNIENVVGSNFDDIITGDVGANVLDGGSGNDTLRGGGGNDRLIGGIGNDSLDGGAGNNTVDYSLETQTVIVNLQVGTATGQGIGADTLTRIQNVLGSSGNDQLTGNGQSNVLEGRSGSDVLAGRGGNDTLDGGDGIDTADYSVSSTAIHANLGVTAVNYAPPQVGAVVVLAAGAATGAGTDTLISIENLTGGSGRDILWGDANNNVLVGNGGNDVLHGGGGLHNTFDGGAGGDTADYSGVTESLNVYLNYGYGYYDGAVRTVDTYISIENVTGGSGNDLLFGDDNNNLIVGGDGNDGLYSHGNLGNITFRNDGNDTIFGGNGDDYMVGGFGRNVLDGGVGFDRVNYHEYTGSGGLTINLTTGFASNNIATNQPGGLYDTLTSVEWLIGSSGNDKITGVDHFDGVRYLYEGGDGNDAIIGKAGDDFLIGGAGKDTLSGGHGTDYLYAFTGDGSVVDGPNVLYGDWSGADANPVSDDNATDWLFGASGKDAIFGNGGNDYLYGEGGDDILSGGLGDDYLIASQGNDTLFGGSGTDVLTGGTGDDRIEGGAGADSLYGDSGQDTFVFKNGFGVDTINDFTAVNVGAEYHDIIEISTAMFQSWDVLIAAGALTDNPFGYATLRSIDGQNVATFIGVHSAELIANHLDDFRFVA